MAIEVVVERYRITDGQYSIYLSRHRDSRYVIIVPGGEDAKPTGPEYTEMRSFNFTMSTPDKAKRIAALIMEAASIAEREFFKESTS